MFVMTRSGRESQLHCVGQPALEAWYHSAKKTESRHPLNLLFLASIVALA